MDISFVIPAYNEETYIGECLDSVFRELGKSNYEAEVIVVNNASTDGTANVVARYKNVIVVNESRKGLTRARQAGFLASKGDLVANIDADTRLTPGWMETVTAEFSKNPKLVGLSGPFVYYDLSWLTNLLVKFFYGIGFVMYLLNRYILKTSSMLQGGNFVVRRSALKKIHGFDTDIDFYGEDTDVARRLHKVGDVKFTFRLPMYSSGRRLANEGVVMTGIRYAWNYFWVSFFKKPFTKTSTDVRSHTPEHPSGIGH